jgi:hypothetical protein
MLEAALHAHPAAHSLCRRVATVAAMSRRHGLQKHLLPLLGCPEAVGLRVKCERRTTRLARRRLPEGRRSIGHESDRVSFGQPCAFRRDALSKLCGVYLRATFRVRPWQCHWHWQRCAPGDEVVTWQTLRGAATSLDAGEFSATRVTHSGAHVRAAALRLDSLSHRLAGAAWRAAACQ